MSLSYYAASNDLCKVKELVSIYLDDVKTHINDAVQWASYNGRLEVVEYLVSVGANVESCYNFSVKFASANGHFKVVKYLISAGADIKADDNYAVRHASANEHFEVVKYLVSAGADVNKIKINDSLINNLLDDGYFELLYELLKNNNDYQEIKKMVSKINFNSLINSAIKINFFKDILIVIKR